MCPLCTLVVACGHVQTHTKVALLLSRKGWTMLSDGACTPLVMWVTDCPAHMHAELKASPALPDGPAPQRASADVRRRSLEGSFSAKRSDRSSTGPQFPPASPRHAGRAAGALASAQVLLHAAGAELGA